MVKRLIIAAIAGLALAALGTHLSAYVYSGHRWPGNSVPFYVNPANRDVTPDAAITALRVAASNWKNQSTADINVYYAGTTTGTSIANNGKNEVFFRDESSGSTAAVTYWWYGGDGKLLDADIKFFDSGFKFFTGQSGCSQGIYIEDLATHEFGHFIGILHSADATATMYPTVSVWCGQDWRYLAQDDIAAVRLAYPSTTQSTGAPAAPTSAGVALGTTIPQVKVAWVDNSTNETGFRVERSTDGLNFTIVGQPGTNVRSFLDQSTGVQCAISVSSARGERQRRFAGVEYCNNQDARHTVRAGGGEALLAHQRGDRCHLGDLDWLLSALVRSHRRDELRRLLRYNLQASEDRDSDAAGGRFNCVPRNAV